MKPLSVEINIDNANTVGDKSLIRCFNNSASVGVVNQIRSTGGTVALVAGSNAVVGTGTNFQGTFAVNQNVFVEANSSGGGYIYQIGTITDNTHLTFKTNSDFANASGKIFTVGANASIAPMASIMIKKSGADKLQGTNIVATTVAYAD